jgi:hypothetical protein
MRAQRDHHLGHVQRLTAALQILEPVRLGRPPGSKNTPKTPPASVTTKAAKAKFTWTPAQKKAQAARMKALWAAKAKKKNK